MISINLNDLCYARDGYTVVNCSEYERITNEASKSLIIILCATFGGLGLFCICLLKLCDYYEDSDQQFHAFKLNTIDEETDYSTCDDTISVELQH